MTSSLLRTALVLGLLSAVGPFAIDMYLPAMPALGADLQAGVAQVQASLTAFFASFAVAQMVYGPASDRWGRKRPLLLGLALFLAGSVGCALAPDIGSLVAFRFLQGAGAAAPMVIPRAIVRDLHTGEEAARLTSLLMLVFSVSPILAPLSGSAVSAAFGWRAVFWAVALIAVAGMWLGGVQLPETRSVAERRGTTLASTGRACVQLLRDRHFVGLTLIGAMGMSSFFVYLANSSFVLIQHYGVSSAQYSLLFSVNAVAFIGASQFTARLVRRFGLVGTVRVAAAAYAGAMLLLALLWLLGVQGLALLVVLLFIGYGFLGLVVPATAVLGMEAHGPIAGTASALMGTMQMVVGAAVIALAGRFVDGTALPMVVGIAACALAACALSEGTLRRARGLPAA
jgi:DHA1 family bicyclomycin/chloramphenicol resistance-like MFS transporter